MKNFIPNLVIVVTVGATFSLATAESILAASFPLRSSQIKLGNTSDGAALTLQNVLNSIGAGVNAGTQQSAANQWKETDEDVVASLIVEIAGFKDANTFGIYDVLNPTQRLVIFTGADSAAQTHLIEFDSDGDIFVKNASNKKTLRSKSGFGDNFGFYLTSKQGKTFFTEDFRNPGGLAQALVYEGTSLGLDLNKNGSKETPFNMGLAWLMAWEDKAIFTDKTADRDYQDMVVLVRNIEAVPEPLTILGVGTALGFGTFFKRKLAKKAEA